MNILFKILFNNKSNSTHSKIALDALRILDVPEADKWKNVFLKYNTQYMRGSRAPDREFHDFRNHVLHVKENYWGGAPKALKNRYMQYVAALKAENWDEAAFQGAVATHYLADPHQPLHTGQTEAEGKVHKFIEWGTLGSYTELQGIIENAFGGFPAVEKPSGKNWLEKLVKSGADLSNLAYDDLIDHYNLKTGRRNPPAGLDQESKDRLAELLAITVSKCALMLAEGIKEAGVAPPEINLTLTTFIEELGMPKHWITRKLADRQMRKEIEQIYAEIEAKGKVVDNLPADDKTVRALHAKEVLKVPLTELDKQPAKETGTKFGTGKHPRPPTKSTLQQTKPIPESEFNRGIKTTGGISLVELKSGSYKGKKQNNTSQKSSVSKSVATQKNTKQTTKQHSKTTTKSSQNNSSVSKNKKQTTAKQKTLKFYLNLTDPVDNAPEIGKKTAGYLQTAGIITVKDLLAASPAELADVLNNRRITEDVIIRWQKVAKLQVCIPFVRGHDVQILVRTGYETPDAIALADPTKLLNEVSTFVATSAGEKILRSSSKPDADEINDWINWAKQARSI